MAHIEKYKAPQVAGLLEHNARTDETRPHNHSNEDIDPDKTRDNYELHSSEGTAYERYKERMAQLHCMQRDDVNVFDSLIVTMPKDVKAEDERTFFEAVYAFACEDYGKDNIVNATVHKDETSPHIHIGFIPVVQGTTRKGEPVDKVCHKQKITKSYLNKLHPRLNEHISSALGYEVAILNGATAGGNKTVQEMKAAKAQETAEEAVKAAQEIVAEEIRRTEQARQEREKEEESLKKAKSDLAETEEQTRAKQKEFDRIDQNAQKRLSEAFELNKALNYAKGRVNALQERLGALQSECEQLENRQADLKAQNGTLEAKNKEQSAENDKLWEEYEQLVKKKTCAEECPNLLPLYAKLAHSLIDIAEDCIDDEAKDKLRQEALLIANDVDDYGYSKAAEIIKDRLDDTLDLTGGYDYDRGY